MTPPVASIVNLDTGAAFAFVAEGSPVRAQLKAFVQGKVMIMCQTAQAEFLNAVSKYGGPLEQARAARLLTRLTGVPDNPSPRVLAERPAWRSGAPRHDVSTTTRRFPSSGGSTQQHAQPPTTLEAVPGEVGVRLGPSVGSRSLAHAARLSPYLGPDHIAPGDRG